MKHLTGAEPTDIEAASIMGEFDLDGDGIIDFDEVGAAHLRRDARAAMMPR